MGDRVIARVHCSYHKCLTVFFERVMHATMRGCGGYRHFHSARSCFEAERASFSVSSLNNHALDPGSFGDCRITRFVRDPRDLVVSGYFYHRRGAEQWCHWENKRPGEVWHVVNAVVPGALRPGESLTAFLQRIGEEEGLIAEIELRARHFASMRRWPVDDPRIRTWRYEDILGHEPAVMDEVAAHYGLPRALRVRMRRNAIRFDAAHAAGSRDAHVRNPSSGQWRSVFTPRVEEAFMSQWADLLPLLGYAESGALTG